MKAALLAHLRELEARFAPAGQMDGEALLAARHERYRRLAPRLADRLRLRPRSSLR